MSNWRSGVSLPGNIQFGPPKTPRFVWWLIGALAVAFLFEAILTQAQPFGEKIGQPRVLLWFGLQPERVFKGWLWQPLTWMFVHADLRHLLGNVFFLWMFGGTVAEALGRKRFLLLFLGGGYLAGLLLCVASLVPLLLGVPMLSWLPYGVPAVGASGAIFAVITLFGLLFPDRPINLILIPIVFPARLMVPLALLAEYSSSAGGVSHGAHIAGVIVGLLWWRFVLRRGQSKPPAKRGLRVVGGSDPSIFH